MSFEDLWARTAPGPRKKRQTMQLRRAAPDSPPDDVLPERDISRVCSLVGEGAISKACKHLISVGLWDTENPEVARKLQDLHPQAPPPDLSALGTDVDALPRFTWDNSLRGKADRLHGLLAMIGSFPRALQEVPRGFVLPT